MQSRLSSVHIVVRVKSASEPPEGCALSTRTKIFVCVLAE
jgi:hypothetical protein